MNSEHFSRNLRRLRLQKNLTQEQVAAILGLSAQSISRWECSNTLPDVMLLPQIARLYGVTVDDLYRADAMGYPTAMPSGFWRYTKPPAKARTFWRRSRNLPGYRWTS